MKTVVSVLAIMLSISLGIAQENGVNIMVTIDNVSSDDGKVGPPTFEMAKFEVTDEDLEFTIRF